MMVRSFWSFAKRLYARINDDNLSFLAGGVAFYGLLALFPAMAGLVSLFGLFASPQLVRDQLENIQTLFPPDVYELIRDQLLLLLQQTGATLSLTVLVSLILAIYSATKGTKAMLAALNSVFRVIETRSWFWYNSLSFLITLGGLVLLCMAITLIVAVPLILQFLPTSITIMIATPLGLLRWVVLGATLTAGLILLYSLGPNKKVKEHRLSAVTIGALCATGLWLLAALVWSWVVVKVPSLHAAYGSLSAVVGLMLWMLISAYTVLFGAAVTACLDVGCNKMA